MINNSNNDYDHNYNFFLHDIRTAQNKSFLFEVPFQIFTNFLIRPTSSFIFLLLPVEIINAKNCIIIHRMLFMLFLHY